MNFQISGRRTALTSVHLHYKICGSDSTRKKAQAVNDLRRQLIDVWVGAKQSVICGDAIDQWRFGGDVFMPTFEPQVNNLNILHDIC